MLQTLQSRVMVMMLGILLCVSAAFWYVVEDRLSRTIREAQTHQALNLLNNIISQLDLMLSMDSGNGHLSAVFGVPTLTLWGVTHPYAGFTPYGQPETNSFLADRTRFPAIPTSIYGNRYPKGYGKAINTIPVSQIQGRIRAILGWK